MQALRMFLSRILLTRRRRYRDAIGADWSHEGVRRRLRFDNLEVRSMKSWIRPGFPVTRRIARATLVTVTSLSLVTGAAQPAERSYRFFPLPGAIAIANDGTTLSDDGICRQGDCHKLSVDRYTTMLDINASGTVVGEATDAEGGVPECKVSQGFIRDRNGNVQVIGSGVYAINDRGDALGYVGFCISGYPFLITSNEIHSIWHARPHLESLPGVWPLSINAARVILVSYFGDGGLPLSYALSDETGVTVLQRPDLPGMVGYQLKDLNNQGEIAG